MPVLSRLEGTQDAFGSSTGPSPAAGEAFWPAEERFPKLVDPRAPGLSPNPASLLGWIDADHADTPAPSIPAGHLSKEIKVEFEGAVSGAIVLTVDTPITALEIVQTGEPAVIARWFEVQRGELVMSAEGQAWVDKHQHTKLGAHLQLTRVSYSARKLEGDRWDLTITFRLRIDGSEYGETYGLFVVAGPSSHGLGARHGDLAFEPYAVVNK